MKNLFNEKGHLMVKFLVNQVAMSVFGIMMSFTAAAVGNSWLLAFGLFALLFYYFIMWSYIWEDGAKDGIKVSGGRMKKNSFLGLGYCAIASIPSIIFAVLLIVFNLTLDSTSAPVGVMNIVVKIFTFGMYNAIDSYFAMSVTWFKSLSAMGVTYLLYSLVTLIVCHLAYYFGTKQIKLRRE